MTGAAAQPHRRLRAPHKRPLLWRLDRWRRSLAHPGGAVRRGERSVHARRGRRKVVRLLLLRRRHRDHSGANGQLRNAGGWVGPEREESTSIACKRRGGGGGAAEPAGGRTGPHVAPQGRKRPLSATGGRLTATRRSFMAAAAPVWCGMADRAARGQPGRRQFRWLCIDVCGNHTSEQTRIAAVSLRSACACAALDGSMCVLVRVLCARVCSLAVAMVALMSGGARPCCSRGVSASQCPETTSPRRSLATWHVPADTAMASVTQRPAQSASLGWLPATCGERDSERGRWSRDWIPLAMVANPWSDPAPQRGPGRPIQLSSEPAAVHVRNSPVERGALEVRAPSAAPEERFRKRSVSQSQPAA